MFRFFPYLNHTRITKNWFFFFELDAFLPVGIRYHLCLCLPPQLVVSGLLLRRECQRSSLTRMTTQWKSVCLFPIPSLIYLVHNNVQFATLTYVDTSTYQIMGNLKIVTTGILFRCFLGLCLMAQII